MVVYHNPAYWPALEASYFKQYLIACEYLQIDPSVVYELEFISRRAESALAQWNASDDQKLLKAFAKSMKYFVKNYNGWMSYWHRFAKKCDELIKKEQLKIFSGTVNAEYQKKELTRMNYDFYAKKQDEAALIALAVALPIMAGLALLFYIIFL
jgi:hypothetical protein